MSRLGRAGRIAIVMSLGVTLVFLSSCSRSPSRPSPAALSTDERVQVYSSIIRQLYLKDGGFPGPTVYLVGWTDDSQGGGLSGPSVARSSRIPGPVREGVSEQLEDLPLDVVWVESSADVPRDRLSSVVGGTTVSLGRIVVTSPLLEVAGDASYGALGAHGAIYKFRKLDGVWTPVEEGMHIGWQS